MEMQRNVTLEMLYLKMKTIEEKLNHLVITVEEEKESGIPVTALLSEKSLAKDWLTPEETEAWKDL